MEKNNLKYRDLNWLYFNERVLLEAENKTVPLLEPLKFLAIFFSNLDGFIKVRVSRLRQIQQLDKKLGKKLMFKANSTLTQILKTVHEQQGHLGEVIAAALVELEQHNIFIRNARDFTQEQKEFLSGYFNSSKKGIYYSRTNTITVCNL